jgi:hypothetical protein
MVALIVFTVVVLAVIVAAVVVSRRRQPNAPGGTGQRVDAAYVAAAELSRHNDDVGHNFGGGRSGSP